MFYTNIEMELMNWTGSCAAVQPVNKQLEYSITSIESNGLIVNVLTIIDPVHGKYIIISNYRLESAGIGALLRVYQRCVCLNSAPNNNSYIDENDDRTRRLKSI